MYFYPLNMLLFSSYEEQLLPFISSLSIIFSCILHNLEFFNNWLHLIISIDAVSDRDFVLEFLSANSITAIHLSRLGEEWVLWASEEFGFLTPSDSVSTGSSIMPQKKNPDPMELVRGKSARVVGDLVTLLVLCKGLPLAYNRDLQVKLPYIHPVIMGSTTFLCHVAFLGGFEGGWNIHRWSCLGVETLGIFQPIDSYISELLPMVLHPAHHSLCHA